jgi:hypothetical protein
MTTAKNFEENISDLNMGKESKEKLEDLRANNAQL